MAYAYFYIYLALSVAALMGCTFYRNIELRHVIIGITTAGCSIVTDTILGSWMGYYHYLDYANSALYLVLAGVFIYPVLNMIYVLFLPKAPVRFLTYTLAWIVGMILFEYLSVRQKIVVFTGWKPIPWSLALYAVTYLWVNLFDRFLKRSKKPLL